MTWDWDALIRLVNGLAYFGLSVALLRAKAAYARPLKSASYAATLAMATGWFFLLLVLTNDDVYLWPLRTMLPLLAVATAWVARDLTIPDRPELPRGR